MNCEWQWQMPFTEADRNAQTAGRLITIKSGLVKMSHPLGWRDGAPRDPIGIRSGPDRDPVQDQNRRPGPVAGRGGFAHRSRHANNPQKQAGEK